MDNKLKNAIQAVLDDIYEERACQDVKWGEQNHEDGTSAFAVEELCNKASSAASAKLNYEEAVKYNNLTWSDILWEEMCEAMEETEDSKLRYELVQVAAVAAAWIEAIDRRNAKRKTAS